MFLGGVRKIGISGRGGGYILWVDFGKSRGEGGGGHMKNPFCGWGMDIFWNHTITVQPRCGILTYIIVGPKVQLG